MQFCVCVKFQPMWSFDSIVWDFIAAFGRDLCANSPCVKGIPEKSKDSDTDSGPYWSDPDFD
jgi:hypothetical protein